MVQGDPHPIAKYRVIGPLPICPRSLRRSAARRIRRWCGRKPCAASLVARSLRPSGDAEPRAPCVILGLVRKLRSRFTLEARRWRYRLGVRTSGSQPGNPGSIPGTATNSFSGLFPARRRACIDQFLNRRAIKSKSAFLACDCFTNASCCATQSEGAAWPFAM